MKFKVFLINLDVSTDRLELCRTELNKFNIEFERVPGVYGKDLSAEQVDAIYSVDKNRKLYKKPLSLGEIGCYLSHISCWQKMVDEDLDYAVILEDDFILSEEFNNFESLLPKLQNWDYIRLAFSSRQVSVIEREKITENYDLVRYEKVPINTLAQAVSRQGALKLLKNSKQIFRPVDVDVKHYWEKEIEILGIDPPLIKQQIKFISVINKIPGGKGRREVSSFWRHIKYVITYSLKKNKFDKMKSTLINFIKK